MVVESRELEARLASLSHPFGILNVSTDPRDATHVDRSNLAPFTFLRGVIVGRNAL
jgi:hypothetical protein